MDNIQIYTAAYTVLCLAGYFIVTVWADKQKDRLVLFVGALVSFGVLLPILGRVFGWW